ncbi:MAG: hypothetical protein DI629_14970 [Mesorhizobium amorphae]|nr:MAG: hypothetical protein DI629_14970 [Mesorhizobium amorphae]
MALPANAHKLYKDFTFGAPKAGFTAEKGFYPCFDQALCRKGETFLGKSGELMLDFKDDKLSRVGVSLPIFPDPTHGLLIPVATSGGWAMASIINRATGQSLDIFNLNVSVSEAEASAQTQQFSNDALAQRAALYALVEITPATKDLLVNSVSDFFAKMPPETRVMRMHFVEANGKYIIDFMLPNLEGDDPDEAAEIGKF